MKNLSKDLKLEMLNFSMISKERLEKEIKQSEELIERMHKIIEDSESGIAINQLVLAMFKDELAKI